MTAGLLAHPVAPPLSIEEIAHRAQRARARQTARRAVLLAAVLLLAASAVWPVPRPSWTVRVTNRPDRTPTTEDSSAPTAGSSSLSRPRGRPSVKAGAEGGTQPRPKPGPAVPDLRCEAGANGGATDRGVTDRRIDLFMSATLDGPNASMLGAAPQVVSRVIKDVNEAGGICGRLLNLKVRNGFSAPPSDVFAAMVGPLYPELDRYVAEGAADRAAVPIVGTDGRTAAQFRSPWVWPVGAPVASLTRIAVEYGYRSLNARTFALVYAQEDAGFGEAVAPFREYVASLPGASVRIVQALPPGDQSYAMEVNEFNAACGGEQCDLVVWAVDLYTAQKWASRDPAPGRLMTAGLSSDLAHLCQRVDLSSSCSSLHVWDAFTPPIDPFLGDPAVRAYQDAGGQAGNPLVEGAYVGAQVLVEAIRRTGPVLTQARLRQVLDEMRFESGLVGGLQWGPGVPGGRLGNRTARALRVTWSASGDSSLSDAGTGWVSDPTPGRFPS
jgi:ABC-type branched-subunit amino acid transport system substrate-binding protein